MVDLLNILIGILILIFSWLGNKLASKLDVIDTKLSSLERSLRNDLVNLERRVIKLEVKDENRIT